MHGLPILFALFQAVVPGPIPDDSAESLRRAARSAERTYESLLRRLAPTRMGGSGADRCDEIVGRFCLIYDGGEPPKPDTVPWRVVRARQDVVEALRRAFAARPGDLETAGPLIRYLIEDSRADEALSAARTFAWASPDSVWGRLLLGYAHHAAGEDSLADARFDEALALMDEEDRRRYESIDVLLHGKERSVYKGLEGDDRATYEHRFWRLADPLYLLSGNERRAEHFARHVWSRLLAQAPRVQGMHRWGKDLEELTLRYGVPTSRERIISWSMLQPDSYVEHYHPDLLTFVPESLWTRGVSGIPRPGDPWSLERDRARSGYAPHIIRRLVFLTHQVARFPAGDSIEVRLYGGMPLDTVASGRSDVVAGCFLLDQRYEFLIRERERGPVMADTARIECSASLAPGVYVYSLELLETATRLAGRARYSVDVPGYPATGVTLSDPVLVQPFGEGDLPLGRDDARLHPLTDLMIRADRSVGLFAEAHRLEAGPDGVTHYGVRLALRRADSPALLTRAVRWFGRTLGLVDEDLPPELEWEGTGEAGQPAVIAVDVPLIGLDPGLYELELTVTDRRGGSSFTSRRLLRIIEGSA